MIDAPALPTHRHVPGSGTSPDRTPLDAAKATIAGPPGPRDWHTHVAYRYGARLHLDRFHWEAHEVWEAVWLVCPPNSRERNLVRALIQLANAALKLDMGRQAAAARLLRETADLLAGAASADGTPGFLGVDVGRLRQAVAAALELLETPRSEAAHDEKTLFDQYLLEPIRPLAATGREDWTAAQSAL